MDRELERLEQLQSWIEMMDRLLSGEAVETATKPAKTQRRGMRDKSKPSKTKARPPRKPTDNQQ